MKAIYVRTSTDDQDGEAQLHELRTWCAREGWQEVKEYVDRGESGAKTSRPAWDRLRNEILRGKCTAMVCTEISRLGRLVVGVILALEEAYRAGCRVVLLRQGLDYGTPVGRAVAAILAAVAQLEREQICERVRSGMRRAREAGTRSGRKIGRPRVAIAVAVVEEAREMRSVRGMSWAEIERMTGIPSSTMRRVIGGCQKAGPYAESAGT